VPMQRLLWGRRGGREIVTAGEVEVKARPATGCALDGDGPAVAGDDPVNHGQTQARPLAKRLRGEERLEDPHQNVVGAFRGRSPGW